MGLDARITAVPKASIPVVIFNVGNVEYQLNQSTDADGRFSAWIKHRGYEGFHH